MTVTDPRVLLLPTCSRPLFSEAFAAWDPPRSPSLRSGAGVSHAAKAKKTCGANANRFQKEHPGIGYDELMSLNDGVVRKRILGERYTGRIPSIRHFSFQRQEFSSGFYPRKRVS